MRAAYHHSARIDPSFHASITVAKGSMHWRSGGAAGSRLIHAMPPHTSHCTGVRSMSPVARLCAENVRDWGTNVFTPSGP
jgi:hypothetical protein